MTVKQIRFVPFLKIWTKRIVAQFNFAVSNFIHTDVNLKNISRM